MKYFLFAICCLFLINDSYGQRRKKKPTKYLTIQGGFLYDGVNKDFDDLFDPANLGPNNYAGFSLLNIRLQRLKNDKLTGIGFKSNFFKKDPKVGVIETINGFSYYAHHYSREELNFTLSLNHGIPLFGSLENGLYAGPSVSLGATREGYLPSQSQSFTRSQKYLSLGGGFHVDYYLKLSKKMMLAIGTQIALMDFSFGHEVLENPILIQRQGRKQDTFAEFRFLRPHFPVMLGLAFSLGK